MSDTPDLASIKRRAEEMRAALQSLHWHYTNNTVNREIMLGIVEEQLGFRAALAADTDAGEGK